MRLPASVSNPSVAISSMSDEDQRIPGTCREIGSLICCQSLQTKNVLGFNCICLASEMDFRDDPVKGITQRGERLQLLTKYKAKTCFRIIKS